eukprot:Opistho-2@58811
MTLKIILALVATLFAASAVSSAPAVASTKVIPNASTRGMWVWGQWPAPLSDPTKADAFFKQLVSPFGISQWKINRIFMEFGRNNLITDATRIRQFIAKAHSYGIRVDNLDGNAEWTYTENKAIPKAICDEQIQFNAGATSPDQRLDGIHYDIEPHTLGAIWRTNAAGGKDNYNNELEANYMEIMRYCRTAFDSKDGGLVLGADVGHDYGQYVTDLFAEIMKGDSVDYLGIMNYFDTTPRFINGDPIEGGGVLPNLKLSTKVPMLFGSESIDVNSAPDWSSFNQEGYYPMESTLLAAKKAASSNPLFGGVAIHHYLSYFALKAGVDKGDSIDTNAPVIAHALSSRSSAVPTPVLDTSILNAPVQPAIPVILKPIRSIEDTDTNLLNPAILRVDPLAYVPVANDPEDPAAGVAAPPMTSAAAEILTSSPVSALGMPERPSTSVLSCAKRGGNATVVGLSAMVVCVVRTDTNTVVQPASGAAVIDSADELVEVELYTQFMGEQDCDGWIGNLACL